MRRQIQRTNPFYELPRFAFGEHIEEGVRLIDNVCFTGQFGLTLLQHKNVEYYGVDKNADAIRTIGFSILFDAATVVKPLCPIFSQRLRNWDDYTFDRRGLLCAARKNGRAA